MISADVGYILQVNLYLFRKEQTLSRLGIQLLIRAREIWGISLSRAILKEHEKNWKQFLSRIDRRRQIKKATRLQRVNSQNSLSSSLAQTLKIKRDSDSTLRAMRQDEGYLSIVLSKLRGWIASPTSALTNSYKRRVLTDSSRRFQRCGVALGMGRTRQRIHLRD